MRSAIIHYIVGIVFLSLLLAAGVAKADIETGLVAHYPFDEGSGGTAVDATGSGNDGTLTGDPQWAGGRIEGALEFDGVDDYVSISRVVQDDFTLAAWIKTDTPGINVGNEAYQGSGLMWSDVGGVANDFVFAVLGTKLSFFCGNPDLSINSTRDVVTGDWVHVVATRSAQQQRINIYIDGTLENAADHANTSPLNAQPLLAIGGNTLDSRYYAGLVDEVRLYDRVLSDADIAELYGWTGGANAGHDQRVEGGTEVTLNGSGPADATSFSWEQIIVGDEPAVTLADPHSAVTTFTPPLREIGYILTFRLTVESPTIGTTSDECQVTVTAPNEPKLVPQDFRTYPGHLAYRLEWDALIDANDYGVGFKLGPGMYFWFWTDNTYYDLLNLQEGSSTVVAVKARNSYGDGPVSEDITLVPMKNYALPASLQGTKPPSGYVYVISHYTISGMNNKVIEDDTNDSWNGLYKEKDYWGYLWPQPIYMDHVVYFTGNMFSDGGWFTDLKVQYTKDGTTWIHVPTTIRPPYNFADARQGRGTYERYDLELPTLRGTGVRIYGTPGGIAGFTSISELQVLADHVTVRPLVVQGIDAEVPERGTGTIDASFSFSTRGDITSMIYEQIGDPSVTIEVSADPLIATFEAPGVDADTELVFEITGSDGTETLSDDATITVKNLVTTAVAGPDQSVEEGTAATLDGSGSVTTTGTLTYQWTQTSGDPVTLHNASEAVCTFDAPIIWDYTEAMTFRLDVNDGAGGTNSDEVTIEVRNSLAWPAYPLEGTPDTGYIQDMLHLGDNPSDRILGPLNINNDPLAAFGGQAFVNPVPGEQYDFTDTGVTVTRNPMTWTPLHEENGVFGSGGFDEFEQIYHVYIISPDQRDARLRFFHDDEIRIWNDGELIAWRDGWNDVTEQSEDFVLNEGLNSMTIKFEDGTGGNWIQVRLTDLTDVPYDDLYYAFGPSFVLTDAYAVRELPTSYEAGGNVDVTLSMRVNPDNKPSSVTVSEPIPGGLTVVDAGGGTIVGGSLNWSFSGGEVTTRIINYTLGVPAGATGSLNFTGTVSFPTTDSIKGDKVIYEVPSAPQNLDVEMLLAASLSWSANPEEGIVGYRVYRNVNGQGWEEAAFVSGTSFKDLDVVEGGSYNYQVAAVNAGGVEGPLSAESGGKSIKMAVVEAEDFNYGGGLYPGPGSDNVPAVEAPALDDFGAGYDYYFQNMTYPDKPNVYRPKDDVDVREINPDQFIMGYTTVGDWWRYTVEAPPPGPSDPEGRWVKIVLKVASPGGGTVDFYWDETLVGSLPFVTGSWATYDTFPLEDQIQTTPGVHTLRVYFASGELDIDTIGIGFNWTQPTREDLFADDFEDYTTLYSFADLVAAGYTVNNGAGEPLGAWQLWNTSGDFLGAEDPAIAAMTNNYVITDSDLSGSVDVDEELITPNIDCTNHRRVRLDFNMNYRAYPDDTEHLQVAEVDLRTSDDGVTWDDWVNLLRWDTSTVADIASGLEQVDVSAYADGKIIQVRWHFYEANFDYWFAVDDIRVSGDALPPQGGDILTIGYVAGVANLTWNAFGGGNYTVEFTEDLTSGNWVPVPVPGQTWPITDTFWSGDIDDIFDPGAYLRIRSE